MTRLLTRYLILCIVIGLVAACRFGPNAGGPESVPPGTTSQSAPPTEETVTTQEEENRTTGEIVVEQATATPAPSPTSTEIPDELANIDPSGQRVVFQHPFQGATADLLDELVATFNESNEYGITVETQVVSMDELYAAGRTFVTSGDSQLITLPYSGDELDPENAAGLVALQPYIQSERWGMDEAQQGALDGGEEGTGESLAVRFRSATDLLYYNASLLEELGYEAPPESWEELSEMACDAAEAGKTGLALAYSTDVLDPSHFVAIVYSRGGNVTSDAGEIVLDTAEAVEGLTLLQELYDEGCVAPVTEQDRTQAAFGTGDLLFALDSSSQLTKYGEAAEGYSGEWGVASLPHTTPEPVQALSSSSLAIVEGEAEQMLATWLFLKWLLAPAQQVQWLSVTGSAAFNSGTSEELDAFLAENPVYEQLLSAIAYGRPEPSMPGYPTARLLIEEALAQVVEGADPEETLADVGEEVDAVLEAGEP